MRPALRSVEVPQPDRPISPRFRFRRLTSSEFTPTAGVCARRCVTFLIITHFACEWVCVRVWVFDEVSSGTICSSRVSRSRTHFHMQTSGARAFEPFPAALPYLILIIINWNHVDDLTFFHPTLYKTQHLSSSDQIAEKELRAVFGMNHRCVCVCVWYFYLCTVVTDHII